MIVAGLLLGAGCELPEPPDKEALVLDGSPRVVEPRHAAAVLMLEDNLRFVQRDNLAGGENTYRDTVKGLAQVLNMNGLKTSVLPVDEGEDVLDKLANYKVIFLADTLAVSENLQQELKTYVKSGGVLVGIGEVARYDGAWRKDWPFGEVFGLKPRAIDSWGTGVSGDETGLYRVAKAFNEDLLLTDLPSDIDLGTNSTLIWVSAPAEAKVVATFPSYLSRISEREPAQLVRSSIPAVTIRQLERGIAIFCAALPSGRRMGGWKHSGNAGKLLANSILYGSETIVLPPIEPEITIGRNQLAYHPSWPKSIVLRIKCPKGMPCSSGRYTLRDEAQRPLGKGKLKAWSRNQLWNSYYIGLDFTDITTPGNYRVEIDLLSLGRRLITKFRVDEYVVEEDLVPSQVHFFQRMRCGERCHLKDPVTGGYHDATGDWAVRMWSMPHVIWCMARYAELHPGNVALEDELIWALDWCLKMQAPDGAVYASIRPPDDHSGGHSPIQIRPWQDKMIRELETRYSFEYTVTYCAALARAAGALRESQPEYAAEVLQAAQKAFYRASTDDFELTKDIGDFIWAAAELYRVTSDNVFLTRAGYEIPRLLERQLPHHRVVDGDIYGDFFADESGTTFSPQQWKVFHGIGIYLGLIEISRALTDASPTKTKVDQALKEFKDGYLMGMSTLTPYGNMACGLEPTGDGKFKVYHFSHPDAWVRNHGLNCDMLAMATVALELARDNRDQQLRDMAARQVNWLLGNNPLGYSMITGLGQKSAPLIAHGLGTGHIDGGIPNGIIGLGKRNLPVWGTTWDSREYWLPQNAYLISTLGLLEE